MTTMGRVKVPSCLAPLLPVTVFWWTATVVTATVRQYTFVIQPKTVTMLCKRQTIVTVNGQLPGPTIYVHDGDTVFVTTVNRAKYNASLHWHGVRQLTTAWADGPAYVTQCPIQPGGSYTYKFTIIKQEGTLWWHAHVSWLRATVYGALVIYPKKGVLGYPFSPPCTEIPILIGEWWKSDPITVINQALRTGAAPNVSDAFTINGQPGDLYPCSSKETFRLAVLWGQTYMLRIINAAMNAHHFVKIANHRMTVVAVDASYTKPYTTDVLVIGPGQTTDVLLTADQAPGTYYLAARAYSTLSSGNFDNTTTTAIIEYIFSSSSAPAMPAMPAYNDTPTVARFNMALRSLNSAESPARVPLKTDVSIISTAGLGLLPCQPGRVCGGPNGTRVSASMNNYSFVLPAVAVLQAAFSGLNGVFQPDFPVRPPMAFNYTGNVPRSLWAPKRATKVFVMEFNTSVELVFQGTNIFQAESHPMHIHGHSFYVVGEGFGNFNPNTDPQNFNLRDPVRRNTVGVLPNGWAAVRFVADNPGAWFIHCHFDDHLSIGLSTVFIVKNGHGPLATLQPSPPDLPRC